MGEIETRVHIHKLFKIIILNEMPHWLSEKKVFLNLNCLLQAHLIVGYQYSIVNTILKTYGYVYNGSGKLHK
jgi:hypothetical protein